MSFTKKLLYRNTFFSTVLVMLVVLLSSLLFPYTHHALVYAEEGILEGEQATPSIEKMQVVGQHTWDEILVDKNAIEINPLALPLLSGYVEDFSQNLNNQQIMELRSIAEGYQQQTSNELVAVLMPHRQGNELYDIWLKIFRDNKIGSKKNNNGILLTIVTEEKKIRITVGYGLEWAFPDVAASEVIEKYVRPLVNNGDFYGAVKTFYEIVPKYIAGEYTAETANPLDAMGRQWGLLWLIGWIIAWYAGTLRLKREKDAKNGKKTQAVMGAQLKQILIWPIILGLVLAFIFSAWIFVFGLFLWSIFAWWGLLGWGRTGWGWFWWFSIGGGGFWWWSGWGWFSGFGWGSSWGGWAGD